MNPYQVAIWHSPDGYLALGDDGRLLDANPALCRLLGCEREELLALPLAQVFPGSDLLNASREGARHQARLGRPGQSPLFCRLSTAWDPDGSQLHVFIQPDPQPGEAMLARVSHELRTPLHAIVGYAQLLLSQSEDPLQLSRLKALLSHAQSLSGQVNELLEGRHALAAEPGLPPASNWGQGEIPAARLSVELLERLRTALLPDWQRIADSGSFSRIQGFARQVEALAQELEASSLVQYARELEQSCRIFDPQALRLLVGQFPSLLEESPSRAHES